MLSYAMARELNFLDREHIEQLYEQSAKRTSNCETFVGDRVVRLLYQTIAVGPSPTKQRLAKRFNV